MSNDNDVKVERAKLGTTLCKYVLGPLLAALGVGGFAAANHSRSEKGYELLAQMVNQHEQRLDKIERTPASQPGVTLTGPIIIPGARVDPFERMRSQISKAKLAPDSSKMIINPKYAPPASRRAPSQLREVP